MIREMLCVFRIPYCVLRVACCVFRKMLFGIAYNLILQRFLTGQYQTSDNSQGAD
jgi:hypothetical protein